MNIPMYLGRDKESLPVGKKLTLAELANYAAKGITPIGYTSKIIHTNRGQEMMFSGFGSSMSVPTKPAEVSVTPTRATSTPKASTKTSSGSVSAPATKIVEPTVEQPVVPTYLTAKEIADKIGLETDYATILRQMQDVTSKRFDESDVVLSRAERANLSGQESSYNQYLQDLRSRSANAVAAGATKGTMAANSLASLLTFQDANKENANLMNETMRQAALERNTAMAADETAARANANSGAQYLGQLASTMDANYINKYAAELAGQASKYVADAQAKATTNAASIGANASLGAARIGASAPTQYDQIITAFTNDYLAKGYNPIAARKNADMDYASSLRNSYPAAAK